MSETRLNMQAMISGSIHRLSHVYRYSSLPTIRRENVSEHSWYVSFYSYMIARDLESRCSSIKIDYGKLLSRSILHDVEESNSGDVIRTVKYSSTELKEALDRVAESLVRKLEHELRMDFYDTWVSAKADDIEGTIVKIADFASVVGYVIEEIRSGNSHLKVILTEVCKYLIELKESIDYPELRTYIDGILVSITMEKFSDLSEVL